MKKHLLRAMLLALAMLLCACAAQQPAASDPVAPNAAPSDPSDDVLHFALGQPLTFEESYTAADGTTLLTVALELPQLELRTADGALYAPAAGINARPAEVAVRDTFNAEMARLLDEYRDTASLLSDAREHYASLDSDYRSYWGGYSEELRAESCYLTDGLLSVCASSYAYYGGAHSMSGTQTWNFDLTSGEFLTLDAFDAQSSPMNDLGETFTHTLALAVLDRIDAQGLATEYYEDYYSYIFDLADTAEFFFGADGITVVFDPYIIAPYAAGAQCFTIPYRAFCNALDAHTRSLLDIPRDEAVLADFDCAKLLHAWFHLGTAPVDTGAPGTALNDREYYRFGTGASSLDELRALLCTYVDGAVADEWLGTGSFVEVNGALFAAQDATGDALPDGQYTVEWDGDSAGAVVITDGDGTQHRFPFVLRDGAAIFTDFSA